MNGLINKLAVIEEAAAKVVSSAESKKTEIFAEVETQKKALDEEMSQKLKQKIDVLNQNLEAEKEKDLADLISSTASMSENIGKEYEEKHQELAQDILKKLIGE